MRRLIDRWAAQRFLKRIAHVDPTPESLVIEWWLMTKAERPHDEIQACWNLSRELRLLETQR